MFQSTLFENPISTGETRWFASCASTWKYSGKRRLVHFAHLNNRSRVPDEMITGGNLAGNEPKKARRQKAPPSLHMLQLPVPESLHTIPIIWNISKTSRERLLAPKCLCFSHILWRFTIDSVWKLDFKSRGTMICLVCDHKEIFKKWKVFTHDPNHRKQLKNIERASVVPSVAPKFLLFLSRPTTEPVNKLDE